MSTHPDQEFTPAEEASDSCLAGGGEMGALMRSIDWSKTPIGPVEAWSPALRMVVRILLANRFPLLIWWGPHYVQLYNDAYRPIPGAKHPGSMGQPGQECWPEIWHVIGPLVDTPFHGGPATWMEDILLEINRHGFVEETHFTIAYSPVPDETSPHGIGGVLATVHEITEKVVGERRVRALRDLGARAAGAKTAAEACAVAADILTAHDKDIPFALLYLIEPDGKQARLAGAAGAPMGEAVSPRVVDLSATEGEGWPLAESKRAETMQVVTRLRSRFPEVPPGPWSDPPHTAVVIPIASNRAHVVAGFLVAGISARLSFDDSYRGFFELVTNQVSTAIANARAYEEERKRVQALAALDRAKTAFFSNVSHEFRTPLTLMLGPLDDALAQTTEPGQRDRLEMARRNGLRLQKLVNTLLDFSRIEAGRVQALYEPTDLPALTAELASNFRSAYERAGLRLIVACQPHPPSPGQTAAEGGSAEAVYVDREMWEKVVLNLLSNAFKFTLEGEIEVKVADTGNAVELSVRDTGTGITPEQLPHVFERFHRVEGTRARTHEGSGIGLALVQELVKLHGGTITVDSVFGRGSIFRVSIPKGQAHLPPDRIGRTRTLASTALAASHYVEEALRWLPGEDRGQGSGVRGQEGQSQNHPDGAPVLTPDPSPLTPGAKRPRIVLADDNADMREYVRKLLAARYDVEAAPDGEAALAAVDRDRPELILADVMMPRLDGFGLLRALRSDERTQTLPVILVSARAGEEARIEGFQGGADDYLVKPFSARELLARVEGHLEIARLRGEVQEALREADRRKDQFLAMLAHELRNPLAPIRHAVQLLQRLESGEPRIVRAREIIERQVVQESRLLDDLLDVSRISRGTILLRLERLDLARLVRNAVEDCRSALEEAGLTLTLELPAEPVWVEGDPTRLAQVMSNLCQNAAKFTDRGGTVTVGCRLSAVGRRSDKDEPVSTDSRQPTADGPAFAAITVRDTGIGIEPEMLPHVFEAFTQAERSLDRSRGGLGLGLTMVKGLVEQHGGEVRVGSAGPGRGTAFTITLPIVDSGDRAGARGAGPAPRLGRLDRSDRIEDGPAPAEPIRNLESKIQNGKRVLIVEDNPDAAETLRDLLELAGHVVEVAHSGSDAVPAAQQFRPDVVLCDLGLPGMDGHQVAAALRQEPVTANVHLIALTGYGQEEERRRSREAGFDRHLVKPVDLAELEQMLAAG